MNGKQCRKLRRMVYGDDGSRKQRGYGRIKTGRLLVYKTKDGFLTFDDTSYNRKLGMTVENEFSHSMDVYTILADCNRQAYQQMKREK